MSVAIDLGRLVAAGQVRKFRLEWAWKARGEMHYAKTFWHGATRADCLQRFTKTMPQAVNVRIVEEVR